MDAETREKIKKTVREILEEADMNEMTEYKIRQMASQKLEINLSDSKYKVYVRHVVNSFLEEQKAKQKEAEAVADDDDDDNNNNKEFDDDGDLIVCRVVSFFGFSFLFFLFWWVLRKFGVFGFSVYYFVLFFSQLSEKRRVTIQEFRGKTLVSIREYYKKDGKELPSSKGISLTEEQWSAFKKNMPNIEKAVRKMESQTM
ncbi:hypothetical protein DITRI_Ditri04bG0142500 [Diplodiscus trichospermus]